jgi:hypothetical protein
VPDRYVISKHSDGWAIAVHGSMLLICERKKAAIRAVRDALAREAAEAGSGRAGRQVSADAEEPSRLSSSS